MEDKRKLSKIFLVKDPCARGTIVCAQRPTKVRDWVAVWHKDSGRWKAGRIVSHWQKGDERWSNVNYFGDLNEKGSFEATVGTEKDFQYWSILSKNKQNDYKPIAMKAVLKLFQR